MLYWRRYRSLKTAHIFRCLIMPNFRVILHNVVHRLYCNKVDMRVQGHFTITLMYFQLFWYINEVYRPILKWCNLLMNIRTAKKDRERGHKFSFRRCMVTIRDARYIFKLVQPTSKSTLICNSLTQ